MAYDQGEELRVSGWNSRNRLRPGSKHLCGQTCLHKLVDDFMARALTARAPRATLNEVEDEVMGQAGGSDTSLTSSAAYKEVESSARLIATPAPVSPARQVATTAPVSSAQLIATPAPVSPARPPLRMQMELVALPVRALINEAAVAVNEPPRYASRNWRAAAWERERERERELRAVERHPGVAARHRYSS